MKNYCSKCKRREKCIELCKIASTFVDQDYVERDYLLLEDLELDYFAYENSIPEGAIVLDVVDWVYMIKKIKLTALQKRYLYLHYWKGISYAKIGKKYSVSAQNVYEIVRAAKKRIMGGMNDFNNYPGLR